LGLIPETAHLVIEIELRIKSYYPMYILSQANRNRA